MKRQLAAMEHGLQLTRERQTNKTDVFDSGAVDWLLHIDDDELFIVLDRNRGNSVGEVFAAVPSNKSSAVFPNKEVVFADAETKNCFMEAPSFRRNSNSID